MEQDEPVAQPHVRYDDEQTEHDRLRGVRETLAKETDTEERRKLREVKEREAQSSNPYPHKLRD